MGLLGGKQEYFHCAMQPLPPLKARTWTLPLKLSLFEMKAAQSGHVQRGGRELRLGSDVTPNKPRNIGAQIRTQKQKTRSRHQSEAKFRVCECACECVCERVRERERERERERGLSLLTKAGALV